MVATTDHNTRRAASSHEVQTAALTRGIDSPRDRFDETVAFSRGLGTFKPSMLQDLEAESHSNTRPLTAS